MTDIRDERPRPDGPGRVGWSRRIISGEQEPELVGLALSGGGIRSATFALGVLQQLQKLDLLRKVDYLSTVSGGGYIGSWLVASVLRNRYWLTTPTDWTPSIGHLRRYSNYLSPQTGLFSADTWAMWGTWIRNTFLIQLNAVACISAAMALVITLGLLFAQPNADDWHAQAVAVGGMLLTAEDLFGLALCTGMIAMSVLLLRHLWRPQPSRSDFTVQLQIVWPALIGAVLCTQVLWALPVTDTPTFGRILSQQLLAWSYPLVTLFVCFLGLSFLSIDKLDVAARAALSILSAIVATGGTYLLACGVLWTFSNWRKPETTATWCAYVFGPPLLLLAAATGVALMIGVLGRNAGDWRREWWTRMGSWLFMYSAGSMLFTCAAVFGPLALLSLAGTSWSSWKSLGPVLTWLGTVIGGLLAGNSTRSDGTLARSTIAQALSLFARLAAMVFIAGALCLVATLVYVVSFNLSSDDGPSAKPYWSNLSALPWTMVASFGLGAALVAFIASARFDLNTFGLNQFYRNRLVRCYLGATRWQTGKRKPHKFTAFDADDEVDLHRLQFQHAAPVPFRGPFPILNAALNLGGSSDLSLHTRHSASFIMTPLRCGADRRSVGYAPTSSATGQFADGVTLGQAASISGAAASPNMGYDTSPLVSFLLTMFNVRLGWWFPNPGRDRWNGSGISRGSERLLLETFGLADETSRFINVSDGGHFENLGIYELIRRRCAVIIAADGECDDDMAFGSLGRLIRMCRTDFKADIDIDVESIRRLKDTRLSRAHCAVGRITYANGSRGYLIYLKSSVTGDEDVDVQQYRDTHPEFPHEPTVDQFFAEDQFESYRKLGEHIARIAFQSVTPDSTIVDAARRLADVWVAESATSSDFVDSTRALERIWERMRATPGLGHLFHELHGLVAPPATPARSPNDESVVCLELLQLVENTYVGLRLDEHWTHPDNRGWVELFSMWARTQTFRTAWATHRHLFGTRFGYFCRQRLGLP